MEGGQFVKSKYSKEAIYSSFKQNCDSRDDEDVAGSGRDGRGVKWENGKWHQVSAQCWRPKL